MIAPNASPAKILPRTAGFPILLFGEICRRLRRLYLNLLLALPVHLPSRMDPMTAIAASGLRARMESLDLLANNLANASTRGYNPDRQFYSLYAAPQTARHDPACPMPFIE